MRKSLEERIVNFTVEFIKAVVRINEELIYEDYFMLFGKKKLMFEVIALDRMTAEDVMQELEDEQEMDVRQFADDEYCVAYMMCEGDLYEKLYYYSAYQEDIFGDGDEAKKLYNAIYRFAGKYDLWFNWEGGALLFYDNVYSSIHHLLNYEFYNGERTESPIVVLGPDGSKKTMFRIYAYGGLIGRIATGRGETCLAEDKEYPKYLGEDWLAKGDETDRKYLQYMNERHVQLEYSGIEYTERTVCSKLREQLKKMLDEKWGGWYFATGSAEYLDLILKAAEKKFMKTGKALGEQRVRTAIVRQHMKRDAEDGWCVIDMAYKVLRKISPWGKEFKQDIVVFDQNNGFGFIKIKYDDGNAINLDKHYLNAQNVVNDKEAVMKITDELKGRCAYLWAYELISDTIYESIKNADSQNLWQGFLFIGGEREQAVDLVNGLIEKHGEIIQNENCRFAFYPYEDEYGNDRIKNIILNYRSMKKGDDFIKG